jgi:hypothetical protein
MLPPIPALSTGRFLDFKAFVATPGSEKEWSCGDACPWRWADAARVATSVAHAFGVFGVESAPVADLEDEALAWWLSLGPDERLTLSRRAILLAEQLDQQPAAFAFDSRAFRFDQGAWALRDGDLVRHLNTWCRMALAAFYAAPEDPTATRPEIPPAPDSIDEERWRVVWPLYVKHAEDVQAEHKRPPFIREDDSWWRGVLANREEMWAARRVWRKKFL